LDPHISTTYIDFGGWPVGDYRVHCLRFVVNSANALDASFYGHTFLALGVMLDLERTQFMAPSFYHASGTVALATLSVAPLRGRP
jgi:hypothetical protein